MTAPLLFASLEPTFSSSPFSRIIDKASKASLSRSPKATSQQQQKAANAQSSEATMLNLIQSSLLESLNQGVIVASRNMQPLYWNARARALCQHLSSNDFPPLELPVAVSEVCHRLMREEPTSDRPVVMECHASTGPTIRISTRWLDLTTQRDIEIPPRAVSSNAQTAEGRQRQAYILVLLEDCNDLLQEELRIERKKYDLTEREAEVWMLLRQDYSYQDIAKLLQISLNTVKTHVKNVYAKKRSCQGRSKFWCCD